MLSEDKYFRTLSEEELWQRYCGFLDLSIAEFLKIQSELLVSQLERAANSTLGMKIMGNQKPKTVDEFRRMVPLTTYDDYEPYLSQRREDVLAQKPYAWCHSAGRSGEFKWVPYTWEFLEVITQRFLTGFILGFANAKGEVNISPGLRLLVILPPEPYTSGTVLKAITQLFSCHIMPPEEASEQMEFQDRVQLGFKMALKSGVDIIAGVASVLISMGEALEEQTRRMSLSMSMLHPRIISRLLLALLRSKAERRVILPKDIWSVKAIMTGGVDMSIYRNEMKRYWGRKPFEFYGCTESFLLALQSLNGNSMVFVPDTAFLEFIPYEDLLKTQEDESFRPTTVLLDEVQEGKSYEVVITEYYGMPLMRYRTKDVVRITTIEDLDTGVRLPHFSFQRRVDDTINLGGMVWLDEKSIWQAIANTGIKYADWTACKEFDHNKSYLRIYIELKEDRDTSEIETLIDKQLEVIDLDYRDVHSYLDIQPVKVTKLSRGVFERYMEAKVKEGADLAHLKPSHINAPDVEIKRLLQLDGSAKDE